MSVQSDVALPTQEPKKALMGSFERNLTWWVLGCIAVGITLGKFFPGFFQTVGSLKVAEVNLPVP